MSEPILSAAAVEKSFGALKVLGGVDTRREGLRRQRDRDPVAGFEDAELFEGFEAFEAPRRHRGEALQEAGAVRVDPDVAEPVVAGREFHVIPSTVIARTVIPAKAGIHCRGGFPLPRE